jgi:hypothetical protein
MFRSLHCAPVAPASHCEPLERRQLMAAVVASAADAFVESIGVNWRSGQGNSNSSQYNTIKARLGELGIRYVRDSLSTTDATQRSRVLELNNLYGIKFEAFFDTRTNGVLDQSKIDSLVSFYDDYAHLFWGVEGPNEYDASTDPNKYANLRDYQAAVNAKIKANPALQHLPVVGPSYGQIGRYIEAGNALGAGAMKHTADAANIHAYPSGDQFPLQTNGDWDNTSAKFYADARIGNWIANEATSSGGPSAGNARTKSFANWSLKPGDEIYITLGRNSSDVAPIDYLDFVPAGGGSTIRGEAENMKLGGAASVGSFSGASGGKYVSSSSGVATLRYVFSGAAGTYTVNAAYWDESDGSGSYDVLLNANKPIYWTETGYHNATAAGGVSEAIDAYYTPQFFLGGFERGYTKTFRYALIDNASDPAKTDREKNFGLLRYDGTAKPAFQSLKNLISLFSDPGAAFTPGTLDYSLTGVNTTVKHQLFQKRDGKFLMSMYVQGKAHDRATQSITPLSDDLTLTFNEPIASVKIYHPTDTLNPIATYTNPTSIPLTASSKTAIFEITKAQQNVTLSDTSFDSGSSVNSQTSFESAFNVNVVSNNKFNYNGTAGVGGSGAIMTPGGQFTSAVNKTGFAGFATYRRLTQTVDTKLIGTGTASPTGQAFFATLNNASTTGLGGLGFGLRYVGGTSSKFNIVYRNGSTETVLGAMDFGAAAWYRWEAGWEYSSASGTFALSLKLYSLGTSGTSSPTLLNSWSAANISNATLASASTLYTGVHAKARDSAGATAIDNLKITGSA